MNSINYKNWFKRETWTLEQAAYLCHDINPNDEDTIDSLNSFTKRYQYINTDESAPTPIVLTGIKNTIQILNTINWEENGKGIPVNQLINVIEQKGLNESKIILEQWGFYIEEYGSPSSQTSKNSDTNSFPFTTFKSLSYDEITLTFLAGNNIELSARNKKITYSYEALDLRDKRRKEEVIPNKAGYLLASFLSDIKPKPDPKASKHKDTLKQKINTWFGLKGDPFNIVGEPPSARYEPIFHIKEDVKRASNRIKNNSKHQNIDDLLETRDFEEENDEAGAFLKENEKQ